MEVKKLCVILLFFMSLVLVSCSSGSSNPQPSTPPSAPAKEGTSAPVPPDAQQPTPVPTPTPVPSPAPIPSQTSIYGVTIDSIASLSDIVTSLKSFRHKMTARIVFDEGQPASYYRTAISEISKTSFIMGEILDSFYVKNISLESYKSRTTEYLNAFGNQVNIWEVGNEINGSWLGSSDVVAAKMTAAYDQVKASGKVTALTLYYNEGCWATPSEEMFTWANANIPERMKQGLDYLLVSYYEDDCNDLQPNWETVFAKLSIMFPNSKLGFGEVGSKYSARKQEYIQRYYNLRISSPRFIGGYFWWYFIQDMVPMTKPYWSILNTNLNY